MNLIAVVMIALALSADAFAVSVASGAVYKELKIRFAVRMALFFGGFQAIMPLIGYFAGMGMKQYIEHFDHWVAFAILAAIGLKMIYESFKMQSSQRNSDPSEIFVLLMLAVATSIDALAVGITLSLITSAVVLAVIIIGTITFVLSYAGVLIGKRFGHFFENKIEAIAGLILIALGLKILLQHVI